MMIYLIKDCWTDNFCFFVTIKPSWLYSLQECWLLCSWYVLTAASLKITTRKDDNHQLKLQQSWDPLQTVCIYDLPSLVNIKQLNWGQWNCLRIINCCNSCLQLCWCFGLLHCYIIIIFRDLYLTVFSYFWWTHFYWQLDTPNVAYQYYTAFCWTILWTCYLLNMKYFLCINSL